MPPIHFSFKKVDEPVDCLKRWLADSDFQVHYDALVEHGITNFFDFETCDISKLEGVIPKEVTDAMKKTQTSMDWVTLKSHGLPH